MAVPVLPLLRTLADPARFPADSWLAGLRQNEAAEVAGFLARHGLLPAMGGRVTLTDPSPLPHDFTSTLRSITLRTQARNHLKISAWTEVAQSLHEAEIQVVALKGLWFTQDLYNASGHRPMGDLDLLIHSSDAPRVSSLLTRLGYMAHPENTAGRKEWWFDHAKTGLHLDVHLSLTPSHGGFRLPVDGLLERALDVEVHGVPARVLHPEDQFLHFALHAAVEHAFIPFRLLLDIALAWQRWSRDVDWSAVRVRARAGGFERALLTVTLLGADLNGDPLPTGLAGTDVDHLRARVLPWILEHAPGLGNDELTRLIAFRPAISRAMHVRRRPLVVTPDTSEISETPPPSVSAARSLRMGLLALAGVAALLIRPHRQRNAAISYLRLLTGLHRQ